ncbi:Mitochondrial import inner membrane translocase subunit Tim13-A [Taenia crassiceps]|uniref:Mitochondrial import inner membrane translocase subunit n=1 Tax=Taenia crassiceps TaxID=6207 RepID=A0ABR4QBK4_9CEST
MDQQSSALGSLTPAQRAQLVDQMKTEVAIASTRELIDVGTLCFEKCVSRPGISLDNSEQKCLGNCVCQSSATRGQQITTAFLTNWVVVLFVVP